MKLIEYGVKINGVDEYGRTPIFYCFIKIKSDESLQSQLTAANNINNNAGNQNMEENASQDKI